MAVSRKWSSLYDIGNNCGPLPCLCHFVYATKGFIVVSMLAAGASTVSIVATAFIVNPRHFLMSSALAVYLNNSDRKNPDASTR